MTENRAVNRLTLQVLLVKGSLNGVHDDDDGDDDDDDDDDDIFCLTGYLTGLFFRVKCGFDWILTAVVARARYIGGQMPRRQCRSTQPL